MQHELVLQNQITPVNECIIDNDVLDAFYAPVQIDKIVTLFKEFETTKKRIIEVHDIITNERVSGTLGYFFSGNSGDKYGNSSMLRHTSSVQEVFQLEGALNELTAQSWNKALNLTNLMEVMPQKRKNEWHEVLRAWREHNYVRGKDPKLDMPDFEISTVRSTIESLLASRGKYLAERVDGIFSALSRTHVTNSPSAFSKRMIMSRIFNEWGSIDHTNEGWIHDLRVVIAKFMGRTDPSRQNTTHLLNLARINTGQWFEADGGSIRIRAYKVGTAHIEVHPDMAWRLNGILSYLYPLAIPATLRNKPTRPKANGFSSKNLFDKIIPSEITNVLAEMSTFYEFVPSTNFRRDYDKREIKNTIGLPYNLKNESKYLVSEIDKILSALGGVLTGHAGKPHIKYWQFDYFPNNVIHEVVVSGIIPDQKAYQFYPTPAVVATELIDRLNIHSSDTLCEPSAGHGGIADLMPKDQTICCEISKTHCQILREKGHNVVEDDFLSWNPGTQFSCIAMNPPYSEGRWQEHLRKASTMVSPGGRIGAVLPLSARNQAYDLLPEYDLEFSAPFDNAFEGTSISVVLLIAVKSR